MKLRVALLGLGSVLVLAACTQQPAMETRAEDGAAIRAWVDQFVLAWNEGDDATLGPMVAEDAVLMAPDTPPIEGRAAILATMAEGYDIATTQQSAATAEAVVMGDYAYARGTWNLDPKPAAAAADVQALSGKWSSVFKRGAGGDWEVWRWMWNQPSEQAPAGG